MLAKATLIGILFIKLQAKNEENPYIIVSTKLLLFVALTKILLITSSTPFSFNDTTIKNIDITKGIKLYGACL